MTLKHTITQKLREGLEAAYIQLLDHSQAHAGHAQNPGQSAHLELWVVSPRFEGKSLVMRQRMVYKALDQEMKSSIHALIIHPLTPEEQDKQTAKQKQEVLYEP
jgi:BolA protein